MGGSGKFADICFLYAFLYIRFQFKKVPFICRCRVFICLYERITEVGFLTFQLYELSLCKDYVMNIKSIVYQILVASAKELGVLVDEVNREVYADNDYNSISVKASYSTLLEWIDRYIADNNQYLAYGNEIMELEDTGVCFTYNVRRALLNLKIVREAFINPVVITRPVQELKDAVVAESKPEFDAGTKEQSQTTPTPNVEENIIRGVKGLAKYLNRGTTLTQAIINSRLLEHNGAQYRAGKGWNFNKKKIDELLKESPNLLKDIHIKRRKR